MRQALGDWLIAYTDFSCQLEFKARVKAAALSGMVSSSPDVWMHAQHRLQGLLSREPVSLETEQVQVFDEAGALLAQAGTPPLAPLLRRSHLLLRRSHLLLRRSHLLLRRSHLLHDADRVAGRVEVSDSLRGVVLGTALAAEVGLLLGALRLLCAAHPAAARSTQCWYPVVEAKPLSGSSYCHV